MDYIPPPIIVPVPVPVPVPEAQDPRCPHCHKKLKGWSEPSEGRNAWAMAVFVGIVLFSFLEIGGALAGATDGAWERCDAPFSKRYHYVLPTYPAACAATRWLENKEVYERE
jgi:hypothetical protein